MSDKNFDSIDDYLKVPIELLATTDGLVVAVEQNWQPESEYRGGNYVWIYDYNLHGLWYYAHASEITVRPGDFVLAGNKLGMTGRTGFNAAKKRSQTHLHLTFLKIEDNGIPRPINTYKWLTNAKTLKSPTVQPLAISVETKTNFSAATIINFTPSYRSISEWPAKPTVIALKYNFKKK